MAQTIFPVSGMEGGVAIRRAADDVVTWRPPLSLWRCYLLCVLSLGLWLPVWAWRLADDLRRHRDDSIRPWAISLKMFVPGLGSSTLVDLSDAAERIDPDAWRTRQDAKWSRPYLIGGPIAFYQGYLGGGLVVDCFCQYVLLVAFLLLLLLPLPVLAIQKRVNDLKAKLDAPRWTHEAYRLMRIERIGVFTVLGMAVAALLGQFDAKFDRWRGEPLAANQAVVGSSGLYSLTPPDAGWVRVGADQFYPNSDLSLYGPSEDTHILVWVRCDGVSVEDRVRFRRGKKRGAYRDMVTEEERRLLPESLLPISFARYSGTWKGGPTTSLVATVAQGEVMVEVLGQSTGGEGERAAMERMVRSLKPKEDATSCDGR